MQFAISLNMERTSPEEDMRDVANHHLDLLQMAERAGFHSVWSAEHHTIELTIAPNPFSLLIFWGQHTSKIRLGTAAVVAPYWHPIRVAGEAALTDVFTNGRLEFGIARGAFQYEFDRMADGLPQAQGGAHMREMLRAVKALWQGDYAHDGEFWKFPAATSVPKPIQTPHPPVWIAARDPDTFDFAIKQGANIMSTPLSRPFSEVETCAGRLATAVKENPGATRPQWMVLRRACIYESESQSDIPVEASVDYGRRFENMFGTNGTVTNGFPRLIPFDEVRDGKNYEPSVIREAMLFGTPKQAIERLEGYADLGVDIFIYGTNFGLEPAFERRSLELFIEHVMPHFSNNQ